VAKSSRTRHILVWFRHAVRRSIGASPNDDQEVEPKMPYRMMGLAHVRAVRALRREDGQGTVEYVGIMLLLATVLTAVVAAAKGNNFNLPNTIINEVKQAISSVGGK
jgi:hypothetical protein